MSAMRPVPDPYRELGVQRGATSAQIKAAHRALAKRYHPDAPDGDTRRFVAIQEAYLLLSDPGRRRQWDAAHAPGPMRAGGGPVPRPRAASGRWTREEPEVGTRRRERAAGRGPASSPRGAPGPERTAPPAEPSPDAMPDDARREPTGWSASGRDPANRSHTWSAAGVPWWEDFPGPRRTAGRADTRRPPADPPSPTAGPVPTGDTPPAPNPTDVYSRSSGAAWSSAARRYFRRSDSDLPSRGAFRREGTTYVTGARAREVGEEEPRPATRDPGVLRPRPMSSAPRQAFDHEPPVPARPRSTPPVASTSRDGGLAGPGARDRRRRARAAREVPADIGRRVAEVTLAWAAVAVGLGWGAPVAAGCGADARACPSLIVPLQAVLAVVALAVFIAFPVVGRIGAIATLAALAVAVPLGLTAAAVGLLPPAPPIVAGATIIIGVAYLIGGSVAAADAWRHWQRAR